MHGRQAHPDAALCVVACMRMLTGVLSCSAGDCLHHGLHCQVRWHLQQSDELMTLCSHAGIVLPENFIPEPQACTAKQNPIHQNGSGYKPQPYQDLTGH